MALLVKSPPANAGDLRDPGSIPGLGRATGGEHGNPLQYSCLENPADRGAWWAMVRRVTLVGGTSLNCPLKVSPLASPSWKTCQ